MTGREGARPDGRPNAKRTDDRANSVRSPRYDAGRSARGAASGDSGASGSRKTSGTGGNRTGYGETRSRSRAGNEGRSGRPVRGAEGSRSRAGNEGRSGRRNHPAESGRVRPQRRRSTEAGTAGRQRPVPSGSSRAKKIPQENIYKGAAKRQGSAIIFTVLKAACFFAIVIILYNSLSGGRLSSVPFADMQSAVTGAADMNTMQEADNQMIKRLYGLDPASFDGICLYYPLTNMGAEELFLVKLQDTSQQDEVKNAIESRLSTQKKSFEGYGIEQSAMLNRSVSEVRGNYAVFISADDTAPMKNAFDKTY